MIAWQNNVFKIKDKFVVKVVAETTQSYLIVAGVQILVKQPKENAKWIHVCTGVILLKIVASTLFGYVVPKILELFVLQTLCSVGQTELNLLMALFKTKV